MITLLSLLACLLLTALVHEGGHYIAARLCGVVVPHIQLGVGPHLVDATVGGTRWRLGLVPLGGYTRVHGMLASDARVPVRGDFRLLHPVQQGFIVLGGPLGNLALAGLLHGVLALYTGHGLSDALAWAVNAPVHVLHGVLVLWADALGVTLAGPRLATLDGSLYSFLHVLASGSVLVGMVNLMPAPATDGGRLVKLIRNR